MALDTLVAEQLYVAGHTPFVLEVAGSNVAVAKEAVARRVRKEVKSILAIQ